MAESIGGAVVRLLFMLGGLALVLWLALKALAFLRNLFRPVRTAVRGVVAPLERAAADRVADALDQTGMAGAARATRELPARAARLESAIGRALDAVWKPRPTDNGP